MADSIVAGDTDRSLAQRTALLAFSIRIVSAFIAYVSQVLMARWLGADAFGVFIWVWVIAVILGGLSCTGFASALVRFVPQYRMAGDEAAMRGMAMGSRLYTVSVATTVALIGCAGVWYFGAGMYTVPLWLAATTLPMLALAETQDGMSRAFNWVDLALAPTFLVRPCLILAFMAGMLATGWAADAQTALIASIVATWVTSLGQMFVANYRLKRDVPLRADDTARRYEPRTWILVALPIFLVEGFFFLLTNVDILIAGLFLPPADVAVYYAAVKTLALVHFVYFAVKAGAAHRYAQYHNAGDFGLYEGFVRETVRWTFWPSLAMGLLLLLAGKPLLSLFGEAFAAGYPLLFILVIGIVARSAVGPAESVLTMSGQQNVCALVFGATLAVNIVLNVVLIPRYGLIGAACGTTVALIFEATALYAVTLRRLGLRMFVFSSATTAAV